MNVFARFNLDQNHPASAHTPDLLPKTPEDPTPTESAPLASEMSLAEPDAGQADSSVASPADRTALPVASVAEGSLVPVFPPSIVQYGTGIHWKRGQACFDAGIVARANVALAGGMADKLSPAWRFRLDAEAIGKISRITQLKSKGAPDPILTVGAGDLTCTIATTKGDFTVAHTVPLREIVQGRCFAFQINGEVIARIGALFEGPMTFAFDPEENSLHWYTDKREGRYSTTATSVELPDVSTATSLAALATVPIQTLAEAVGYAALFASKAIRSRGPFDGLRIGGGSATSGYIHAMVKYASATIPDDLDIVVPIRQAGNLKAVLAKLSGPIEVATTDASVHLRTEDTRISWIKDGNWPAALDKTFQLPVKSSVTIPTADLQKAAIALSIATERVEIQIDHGDNGLGRLLLAGHSPSATGVAPISPWSPVGELPIDIWTFSLDVADLLAALLAVRTDYVTLDVIDRGMYLRSRAPSFETTAILLGRQLT
ncbi:hypothetical protein [Bradyrhizobium sp.]|uniref:hypothetical protein n=1 Tax=Bradyrhizobium sp. TaxID=376 RepID=UPI004037BF61